MVRPADAREPVRAEVAKLLAASKAFAALPADQRTRLRADFEKVASFLADPRLLVRPLTAQALAKDDEKPKGGVEGAKEFLGQKQQLVGQEFRAGAVREGVSAFADMVKTVDFPAFVSGLIQNVFQAIVDASIQQMQAFGELLAGVAKSVDQFASDHISDAQARDHLAQRYPGALQIDTSGEVARLAPREGAEGALDLGKAYNLGREIDFDDGESERALVNAAKLEMARSRQQLLSTMVLLGINRIVVTNGKINAKVVFDIRASDEAQRTAKAEMHDEQSSSSASAVFVHTPWALGGGASSKNHRTTVTSSVQDTSESNIEAKAQLTGEVSVQFKSETFPLERMADSLDLQVLNQKAAPVPRTATVAPAPAPAPAPAAGR